MGLKLFIVIPIQCIQQGLTFNYKQIHSLFKLSPESAFSFVYH